MIRHFYYKGLRSLSAVFVAGLLWPAVSAAQDEKPVAPVGRSYAITNATIVQGPGRKIEKGTVVLKDGLITAVGNGVAIPGDAIVIKADSMFVYAGFIDGLSRTGVTKPKEEKDKEKAKDPGNPPPDRAGITPQNDVRNALNPNDKTVEELRNLGFTTAQVVPYGNFLPGTAAIVLLGGKTADDMVLVTQSALYSELSGAQGVYPNTVMAVMAKWRELYKNASLAKSYQGTYASNRNAAARPGSDRILEAFYPVIDQKIPVLFKSERVMETQRVFTLKNDLALSVMIADVKEGWPIVNKIKSSGARVFLSLDLPDEVKKDEKKDEKKGDKKDAKKDSVKTEPKKEKVKTQFDIEKEGLEKRKKEAIASYTAQPADFTKAGVTFGFSSMSAKTKDIHANLRRMIAAGLSEDAALAALTASPAKLLGLDDRMGSIDNGKMANLVISYKPYFDEKSKVKYVFVDGNLFAMETKDAKKADDKVMAKGTWTFSTDTPQGTATGKLVIKEEKGVYSGTITNSFTNKEVAIKDVELDGTKLSFNFPYDDAGNPLTVSVTVEIDGNKFEGTMSVPDGSFPVKATKDPKF